MKAYYGRKPKMSSKEKKEFNKVVHDFITQRILGGMNLPEYNNTNSNQTIIDSSLSDLVNSNCEKIIGNKEDETDEG